MIGVGKQIVKMVQRDGLSVEQCAQALHMKPEEVAAHLGVMSQHENTGLSKGTKEKLKGMIAGLEDKAVGVLDEIMSDSDNPHLQLSAAKFAIEVSLGKHDGAVSNQQPTNVNNINNLIVAGLDRYKEITERFEQANKQPVEVQV